MWLLCGPDWGAEAIQVFYEAIRVERDISPIVQTFLLPVNISLATASHKVGFRVKLWGSTLHLLREKDMKIT